MKRRLLLLPAFVIITLSSLFSQSFRDPFQWPFSQQSIWNMPIGSDAVYKPAHFEPAGHAGFDIQHIVYSYPTYEEYPVYDSPTWGPGRCSGNTYLGFTLKVPRNWVVPDAGENTGWGLTPNSNYAILSPADSMVFEGNKITRCVAEGPVYLPDWMKYPANRTWISIMGDGYDGKGQGASKMSALGGTIRLGELTGSDSIRHVIKINPWAGKYCHFSEEVPGFRWPAKAADSYASTGYNPDADSSIVMGSLFAIPPDVKAESIGIETEPGRKLFYTLQNYGLYFTEDAAWDTWDVVVERGVEEEFLSAYGYSMSSATWKDELNRLMQALSVIDNNGPGSIGGGGAPLAPLAPEFTPPGNNPYYDPMIPLLLEGERDKLPVEGELLYDCANLGGYSFSTNNGATKKIVEAESSVDFGLKFQLDVKKAGTQAWEPQFQSPVNAIPVKTGDVLLYVFYIRTTGTESPNDFGKADFFAQKATSPWNGIGSLSMSLSTSWRKFYMVAKSDADFGVGEMGSTIHLGYLQQKVEIGGILALNLGDVDLNDLPVNDVVYDGMEPDAAWRSEAEARIEQYRKSNLTLRVTDGEGHPVENGIVSIKMKNHAFGFGNFTSDIILDATVDGNNYRAHVLDMFNAATTPFYMGGNGDNWGWYGPGTAQEDYPKMAGWMQANGVPTKGHVLIWPGWEWMPSFFEDLAVDPDGLRAAIDQHLETIVPIGREKGLYQWDVVNEPFINHDVMDILGEEVLVEWYNKVHQLDSAPRLILNEYNIIMGGGRPDFQENFERIISYLLEEGAPLGGIGMQCHFDENLTGIPRVLEVLDGFGKFGLPIQITEFDVAIRDEIIQAEYLRDFYTAVFSHPATDKIVMWGFYEKVMWKPLAALVRTDWTHKPNYDIYMDLLYNKWWTPDATGVTDATGTYGLRGFHGYYEITVEIDDSTYLFRDRLIKSDTIMELSPANSDLPVGSDLPRMESSGVVVSYPNPFNDQIILTYTLDQQAELTFKFYSMDGAMVHSGTIRHAGAGTYNSEFDCSGFPPGIYMCVVDGDAPERVTSTLKIVKRRF